MKGAIYYVAIATVIFSHVKVTCYFHMWRYQVFARKLTWYFIGVYIIILFIIIYSLKCTITNLDENMWHLQLDFRHNCFLPIHHGHTQKERSRFRCIALHLATRYCLLDWQWWDLHCMQRLFHNPGTDKQLRHLTYPILHHTLSSRPQRRKLQPGPLLHLVLPLNELKMNFNIFFCTFTCVNWKQ